MNGMILFLKIFLILNFVGFSYVLWKTYKKQEWNRLLLNKQKAFGKVELLKVKYGVSYAVIAVSFFLFIFTFNSPLQVADTVVALNSAVTFKDAVTEEAAIEDLVQNLDIVEGDMYIVKVGHQVSTKEFNLITSNKDTDLTDYYEFRATVLEEVYASEVTMFTEFNNTLVLDEITNVKITATSESYSYMYSSESASMVEVNDVYLVIGGYINESDAELIEDSRLDGSHYIYSYTAILLEGYDLSKPLSEQSEEIRKLVEKYSKELPD